MAGRRLAITKICEKCRVEFHPWFREQRFCSRLCTGQMPSLTLICDNCGKSYNKKASLAKRVKYNNYCSRRCRAEHRNVKLTCPVCDKSFKRERAQAAGEKENYCSKQCADKAMEVKKPILTCDFCGKQFERYPSEIKKMSERGYRHVFCSHKCRAAMIAAQFDPPQPYRGFTEPTPKERNNGEYKEWRRAVFKRDNYTCQDCDATDVLVCAHHEKAFSLYPELRYDISNGITLCFPCHEKRHSLP